MKKVLSCTVGLLFACLLSSSLVFLEDAVAASDGNNGSDLDVLDLVLRIYPFRPSCLDEPIEGHPSVLSPLSEEELDEFDRIKNGNTSTGNTGPIIFGTLESPFGTIGWVCLKNLGGGNLVVGGNWVCGYCGYQEEF